MEGVRTNTTLLTRMAHWRKIGAAVNGRRTLQRERVGVKPIQNHQGNGWKISRPSMAQPKYECNPLGYAFAGRCDSGSSGIDGRLDGF